MAKVKTPSKIFITDQERLRAIVGEVVDQVVEIVGASLGPGGRPVLIESELPGLPNKVSKDGVSIFRALGHPNPYKHVIIEQMRDAAVKTVNEAGDGTTTATILAGAFVKNLFAFCNANRKYSPQKIIRQVSKIAEEEMFPAIKKASTKITNKNKDLLEKVATISTNGDKEMSKKVMEAFELTGFSSSSHVTIQELSGPSHYEVDLVEGFPIHKGYEESIGKFHAAFINDQANQRIALDAPAFILFDGKITDPAQVADILMKAGNAYVNGETECKNVMLVCHSFSDQVLTWLSLNMQNPGTLNVVPLMTPMTQIINSQLAFLQDLSAFTGASIFGMTNPLYEAELSHLGYGVEKIEINRFRATVVGEPNSELIQARAEQIKTQIKNSESRLEKLILEERLGCLTNGIAQFKIFGASSGEIKEKADRAEDAVCAIRAALNHGVVPGGCRVLINVALGLKEKYPEDLVVNSVIVPSLFAPFLRLLANAGFNDTEIQEILQKYVNDSKIVYDVENQEFGDPKIMGIFDATLAVSESLNAAISIMGGLGAMGGIIVTPRDAAMELQDFRDEQEFNRTIENAEALADAINERA